MSERHQKEKLAMQNIKVQLREKQEKAHERNEKAKEKHEEYRKKIIKEDRARHQTWHTYCEEAHKAT